MSASLDAHNWYTIRDRKKVGPLPWSELCRLAAAGLLKPTDMVLCEGQTRWSEAGSLPGLFPAPVAALAPEGESAPTLAPPMLPSATMLSAQVADTHKIAFVAPIQLPGYELLEELGRGGMGVVYKARQQKASRLVALKMILSGAHAGKEDLARFQTEAEAVARLQHPHIVQVYEIGEHEGRPYFSLEFCGGGTLDRKLRDNPLLPKDAARLVEVLARAMHHAHTHHILHRDLKPANVLLTEDGVPKITDFGLAKKLDETGQTASGAVMGTPSYMSPEQASGKGRHLTPSTDVYALGALLYDCLAGRPPFRAATALDTILQVITDAPVPPAHLNAKVPADLQTICLKCLEKNPTHRYDTAEELAEDLRRFTSGEPIQARPAGWLERGWKWAKRRPAAASLVAVSALALVFIAIGSLSFSVRLGRERNAAVEAAKLAEQERERATTEQGRAEENEREAKALRKAAEEREGFVRQELDKSKRALLTAQIGRAAGLWQREPLRALQLLQDREACPVELRDFAWGYYHELCLSWKQTSLIAKPGIGIASVAVSPNGELVAAACSDGSIKVVELATAKELTTLRGHQGSATRVAFGHLGSLLASGGSDKTVRLWDVAQGKEVALLQGHTGPVSGIGFSPDDRWLASSSGVMHNNYADQGRRHRDGELRLWNVAEKKEEKVLLPKQDAAIRDLSFSPDGKTVAICTTHQGQVRFVDVASGKLGLEIRGDSGWCYAVAYSPNGEQVAWATAHQFIHLAEVTATKPSRTLRGHQTDPYAVAWSRDGTTLASSDSSGEIKLWDTDTGRERVSVRLDNSNVSSMAFTPSGQLVSAHGSGRLTVWQLAPTSEYLQLRGKGYSGVAVSGGTSTGTPLTLAAAARDKTVLLRDLLGPSANERRLNLDNGRGTAVAFSPDGKLLAVVVRQEIISGGMHAPGAEGECQLWDVNAGTRLAILKPSSKKGATEALFTRDGRSVVIGYDDGKVVLWDVAERKESVVLGTHKSAVTRLALSADGKLLASVDATEIRWWDLLERRERGVQHGHRDLLSGLAFVAGDQSLVSVGYNATLKFWDVGTGQLKRTLNQQVPGVLALAANADGQTLALGCSDRCVRLVDVASGQQRALLSGFTKEVASVAFSADNRFLIGGSAGVLSAWWVEGGEVKVWKSQVAAKR